MGCGVAYHLGNWRLASSPCPYVGIGLRPFWIYASTLPFILAALIVNRQASVVETFGRLLFAHWPAVLMLLPAMTVSGDRYALLNNNLRVAFELDATSVTLFALLLAVVVVWIVRWAYVAFRKATQRGGYVMLMLFGVALIVAAKATEWVLQVIYIAI